MPWFNVDLEDGKPAVGFDLKPEDAERFMAFMAQCQRLRETAGTPGAAAVPAAAPAAALALLDQIDLTSEFLREDAQQLRELDGQTPRGPIPAEIIDGLDDAANLLRQLGDALVGQPRHDLVQNPHDQYRH